MSGDPSLPIDALITFKIGDLVKAAEREVRYRQRAYPRMIEAGRMTHNKARYEIAAMEAIAEKLRGIQAYAERRGS